MDIILHFMALLMFSTADCFIIQEFYTMYVTCSGCNIYHFFNEFLTSYGNSYLVLHNNRWLF